MSRDKQRLGDYLRHIVEAIERIQAYTHGLDDQSFGSSPMVQDAVLRNLEVIGEASRNIEVHHPEFAAAHSQLPLAFAYQMRNAISHGYFQVDLGIVWRTIHSDLPQLREQVGVLIGSLGGAIPGTRPGDDWQSFMDLREQIGPVSEDFLEERDPGEK